MSQKIIPEQIVTTCDRCNAVIDKDCGKSTVTFYRNNEWHSDNLKFDFCPRCSDEILKELQSG